MLGGGYYYWQSVQPTTEEIADAQIERIATLTIMNEHLEVETVKAFTEQFNVLKDKFLNDQSIQNFFIINGMGRIKQDVGDYKGAEEAFLFAYNLSPDGYIINGNLANLYHYGLKDYEKAEQFYLDTLAINNIQEGNQYTYFAELYELYFYRINNREKAEMLLDRAMEELPDNLQVLVLAGSHYKDVGNTEKARELFSKIIEIDPTNSAARTMLESL